MNSSFEETKQETIKTNSIIYFWKKYSEKFFFFYFSVLKEKK